MIDLVLNLTVFSSFGNSWEYFFCYDISINYFTSSFHNFLSRDQSGGGDVPADGGSGGAEGEQEGGGTVQQHRSQVETCGQDPRQVVIIESLTEG